jgi:dipeptidyl-peptidase-4
LGNGHDAKNNRLPADGVGYLSRDFDQEGAGIVNINSHHLGLRLSLGLGLGLGLAMWAPPSALGQGDALSIERIFASPSLSGPRILGLQISPDGNRVSYLRGKDEDREQLDLWAYEVATGEHRQLLDSQALVADELLSEEEKTRRERQRLGGLRGIVEYSWADDSAALLIPLGGDLYYHDLSEEGRAATQRLTNTAEFETDSRLSPRGSYASFIRAQNLFVLDIKTGRERQLTQDGGGAIKNGMAEFIAQEEMGRNTGYWWADDESRIAFIRTDESSVDIAKRYEIYADEVQVVEQRYPYAGASNVSVELGIVELENSSIEWLENASDSDFYLPRVAWLPDSRTLSYQWQSRDQKHLELRFIDMESMKQRAVVHEQSDRWVNLNDDLRFLDNGEQFIWASERDGYKHLYLYSIDGDLIQALTAGSWAVDQVEGVNGNTIYFTAAASIPTERHLYSQSIVTTKPHQVRKITSTAGWHGITMSRDAALYLDSFSNQARPSRISLHDANGRELTAMLENEIDEDHPYWPYAALHRAAEFGTLTAADGQTLHFRLTLPPGFTPSRRYPVFLYVYGGPGTQTVVNSWGNLFEQYMLQQGFLVFSLDNRGMARRGTAFETPIEGLLGSIEVEDQLIGVEYLKSLEYVDPQRIGIFGWSYGGYVTLMALLKAPESFAAGVAVAPVTDWHLYDTHYTERYLGHPVANAAGYDGSSVLPWIAELALPLPPLLVVHGMADDNVLFTNSTKLFQSLQDAGQLFDIMTYPGAKHGLSGTQTQTHVYSTIAAFFQKHLD